VPSGGLEDGGCSYDVHMGAARRVCMAEGNLERSEVDDVGDRVFVERPLEEVEVGDIAVHDPDPCQLLWCTDQTQA